MQQNRHLPKTINPKYFCRFLVPPAVNKDAGNGGAKKKEDEEEKKDAATKVGVCVWCSSICIVLCSSTHSVLHTASMPMPDEGPWWSRSAVHTPQYVHTLNKNPHMQVSEALRDAKLSLMKDLRGEDDGALYKQLADVRTSHWGHTWK